VYQSAFTISLRPYYGEIKYKTCDGPKLARALSWICFNILLRFTVRRNPKSFKLHPLLKFYFSKKVRILDILKAKNSK